MRARRVTVRLAASGPQRAGRVRSGLARQLRTAVWWLRGRRAIAGDWFDPAVRQALGVAAIQTGGDTSVSRRIPV